MDRYHRSFLAFAQIVREGSFSGAARAMGISQSAVTQHVHKLEREIGEKLLRRGRGGPELTAAGRALHALADQLLVLDQRIAEKIERQRDLAAGRLEIVANAPLPALRLIGAFSTAFPEVQFDFTLRDWTSAMRLVRERRVDIGVITNPEGAGDWNTHVLERPRYVAYLQRGDPLADEPGLALARILERRLLLPEPGSLTRRVVCAKLAELGLDVARSMTVSSFPLMKEAVLHGVGVGIFLEDSTVSSEGLIMRPITDLTARFETALVVPRDRADLRLIETFVHMALDNCDRQT
ncbi:HTH-type transcriptional activator CmpR [Pseudoruegeria aquimaris]|uniref:HTH-type transcriptional activator CmpR n=1 Tax=Pseudoruegeria aquimaris TaxID=393663 RepID=A0A1Y5RLQ4_9RHOB|nr:LysR substrate-binding domain-containing protein [Pseudoruegeria aquimaris]SLN19419.1 HTH-type transcriptional activator CmpR [Pseudoruegeria aquimaris]